MSDKATPTDELRLWLETAPTVGIVVLAAIPIILHYLGFLAPAKAAPVAPAAPAVTGEKVAAPAGGK